jgi:hypothetical protein
MMLPHQDYQGRILSRTRILFRRLQFLHKSTLYLPQQIVPRYNRQCLIRWSRFEPLVVAKSLIALELFAVDVGSTLLGREGDLE